MAFPLIALAAPIALTALRGVTARGVVAAGTAYTLGGIFGGDDEPSAPVSTASNVAKWGAVAVLGVSAVLVTRAIVKAAD